MHKKARKQFADNNQKDMDCWNPVQWSDETKINLFGSDALNIVWWQPGEEYKYKCVLHTVNHGGGSVMVWGCMSATSTGELQFIGGTMNANMYCDILKLSMIPSLRKLGRRAVFQHDNNPKHTSNGLAKRVSDLNPIEHLWVIFKWKVEEHKVSNIDQLHDVIMEEWKKILVATCEALVNSMAKRITGVLENSGGHTTCWHFGPNLDIFT